VEYLGEADEGARLTFAITALAVPEMAYAARWLADVAGCAAITENPSTVAATRAGQRRAWHSCRHDGKRSESCVPNIQRSLSCS
jgi:hypothetical protein